MDDRLFRILKKVYCKKKYEKDENGYQHIIKNGDRFDCDKKVTIYALDPLSWEELDYLLASGYPVNEIAEYSHDECVQGYKEILRHANLTLENLLAAYLCGFSSFPRGRQPILSYLFAKAVPEHTFTPFQEGGNICAICSMSKKRWVQKGEEIFRNYWGYSWNEMWDKSLVELQEFSELPPCVPTKKDMQIFCDVIDLIRNAPSGETPGKLEQRIRKAKVVPHYEKYRFRGQLITLAELGIMPNPYVKPLYDGFVTFQQRCQIKMSGSARSDVVQPLAGWRGDHPLDEDRLSLLFGRFLESDA
ncbi:MAG: hypothetical protein NC417_06030 [Candidatus Gastranaerophilales bacterium]|nr:hypothetical protein [Candidatus Gastranaerophilales bacterium]